MDAMNGEKPFWSTLEAKADSLAIVDTDSDSTLTYSALQFRVARAAEQLHCAHRCLVLLFANTDLGGIVCYLAALVAEQAVFLSPTGIQHAGAITFDPHLPAGAHRMGLRKPPAALDCDYELGGRVDVYQVLRRRSCTDQPLHPALSLVLSTSASTGSPKAVRLSGVSLASNAVQVAQALAVPPSDRVLLNLPLAYVYGLSVLSSSLYTGAAIVLIKGTFADRSYAAKVASAAVSTLPCATQTLEQMQTLQLGAATFPSLKRLTHAGSRLDPVLFEWVYERFGRHGIDLFLMYGQTEACGRIAVLPPRQLPGLHRSVGRAMNGGAVRLTEQGEIVYQGPGVMLGYARSREDLLLGDMLRGVLHTGDLGRIDAAGNLFITGRLSRYCKLFGKRVNLDEIEQFVRQQRPAAAVEKDGVVGIFLEGEVPVAAADILQVARQFQLPPQSFRLYSLPTLPRNARGKICYQTLGSLL